jgi:acyl-CoA-binding protein
MSLITDEKLKAKFEFAIEEIKKLPRMEDEDKSYFYARYKQATVGDNPQKESPSFFDFVGKAKWNAWNTCLGMTPSQAASEYIRRASELVGRDLSQ